jgi:hypothetical protein
MEIVSSRGGAAPRPPLFDPHAFFGEHGMKEVDRSHFACGRAADPLGGA